VFKKQNVNVKWHDKDKFIHPIQFDFCACCLETIDAMPGFMFEIAHFKSGSRFDHLFQVFVFTAVRRDALEQIKSLKSSNIHNCLLSLVSYP